MRALAPDLWQLEGFPPNAINVYLIGDVLIDAATRWSRRRIFGQLRGRRLALVALTHCHPDHQGMARAVCERFRVPLACHEADVAAMEGRTSMLPGRPLLNLLGKVWAGPPYPVQRVLRDGEQVAGFRVVHAPGHTPGHVFYFRESDRVVLAGDVLANINFLSGAEVLGEPPRIFCVDPAQNRRSAHLLAQLRPTLICFGHGPPLRDPARLDRFLEKLTERACLVSPPTRSVSEGLAHASGWCGTITHRELG